MHLVVYLYPVVLADLFTLQSLASTWQNSQSTLREHLPFVRWAGEKLKKKKNEPLQQTPLFLLFLIIFLFVWLAVFTVGIRHPEAVCGDSLVFPIGEVQASWNHRSGKPCFILSLRKHVQASQTLLIMLQIQTLATSFLTHYDSEEKPCFRPAFRCIKNQKRSASGTASIVPTVQWQKDDSSLLRGVKTLSLTAGTHSVGHMVL